MVLRRRFGILPVAALVLCTWTACKSKSAADLDKLCEEVGKTCGEKEKHVEKIVEECKQGAQVLSDKNCADKAKAVYACYEKELCGKGDPVWTIEDLRVLAERHGKCVAERKAARECVGK